MTTFGSKINKVIRFLDDLHVVFNDGDGVAFIHQFLKDIDQALNVGRMQAGRGLIQNVKRVTVGRLDQLLRQFDTLRLTTGKGRARLAQAQLP